MARATALFVLTAGVAFGQDSVATIPATVSPAEKASLTTDRADLEKRIDLHNRRVDAFKAKCGAVLPTQTALVASCQQDYQAAAAEGKALETEKVVFAARVTAADMLAQVPELAASPAADRIAKGLTAMIAHDWVVALAWWQDALNRDPFNAPLRRSVELARWMVDQKHNGPSPEPQSAQDRRTQEVYRQMALETIVGSKPMPEIDLSNDWWRDHGK